jgi:hypothetical protein
MLNTHFEIVHFPTIQARNRYFLIAMDYFTKRPEEASPVAEAVITNFCRFGVLWKLHIDQGRNPVSVFRWVCNA